MPRIKTISQNIAVFVGQVPATGYHVTGGAGFTGTNSVGLIKPLVGVTAVDYSWSQAKQDVITYGKMASRDRVAIDPPEVPMNITYYLGAGYNEHVLGLYVQNQRATGSGVDSYSLENTALKHFLDRSKDERNFFVMIAPEGADADNLEGSATTQVIGIGNGFVNSYSVEGSVGNFPSVTVGVQGLNIKSYTAGTGLLPAVNPTTGLEITNKGFFYLPNSAVLGYGEAGFEPFVLRPGDISLNLSTAGGIFHNDFNTPDVQSFSVNFDLSRQPINKLGSRFSTSREMTFPINVNFEVSMLAKDLKTDSLADFLCQTGKHHATITMKYNDCGGAGSGAFKIDLRNISLESQNWSTQAGSEPQTCSLTWLGQIGATGDTVNGLFLSGFGAGGYTGITSAARTGLPPATVIAKTVA